MRARARYGLAILLGAITGLALVKPVLTHEIAAQAISVGPWQTLRGTGSASANPYVRSAVAVAGLYALSAQETIYFTAYRDSAGDALDGRCRYRVSGAAPRARWWSFTLYGDDNYLVDNPQHIYSVPMSRLVPDAAGAIAFEVGGAAQPAGWLPAPASGAYSL
ncbi:MAG TPA: DUF1214 domain-containing protein, partial [Nevskiaceae bacterium]|nr:DUF1214 domain-containing protein [Nevskiaceae bacterium]